MTVADEERLTAAELEEARRYSMRLAWDDEDGIYVVSVDEIPGLHTHGKTREDALEMGTEAIATWLAGLRRFGRPVPAAPKTARRSMVDRPPTFAPAEIRGIRDRIGVSQPVFAAILNVSPETVRAWEQGRNAPNGASARLLQLAARNPVGFGRMAHSVEAKPAGSRGETRRVRSVRAVAAPVSRAPEGTTAG